MCIRDRNWNAMFEGKLKVGKKKETAKEKEFFLMNEKMCIRDRQPKILLKELTNIDEIDKNFDFGNYLDARNPETGERCV